MRVSTSYDKLFKVLMVGDSGTDKSGIIARFTDTHSITQLITTIGIDFHIKTIEHRSQQIKFQVWDTAGQERFRSLTTAYYRGAQGLFVVFDMTDRKSFEGVRQWLDETYANTMGQKITVALLGNNCEDLTKHVVTAEEAEKLAADYNIPFSPVSSKTGINITEAFTNLVDSFYFPPTQLSKEEQHLLSTFKSGMLIE